VRRRTSFHVEELFRPRVVPPEPPTRRDVALTEILVERERHVAAPPSSDARREEK
jgi:hypothetical protein